MSDGWSSDYYQLPIYAKELDDLIVAKKMPWHIANIFKACYRYGEKNDSMYELNKIIWMAERHKKLLQRSLEEPEVELEPNGDLNMNTHLERKTPLFRDGDFLR
jgi:hypothetical protein